MPFAPTVADEATYDDVRGHLTEAAQYIRGLRSRPAAERGEGYAEDLRSAVDFIQTFDLIADVMERNERAERSRQAHEEATRRSPAGRSGDSGNAESRSAGQQLVEAQAWTDFATARANGARMPAVEVRNLLSSIGTDGGVFRPVGTPTLHVPSLSGRRPFLRSLMSVQDTGLASVPYIRETSPLSYEGGASAVAEASAKPEVTMLWSQEDAPIRKIAGWIRVTDEVITDAPTLRGYVNTRLAYMVMIREESELLNGTGTAPRLQGILTVGGTQTNAAPTGDYTAIVGRASGKIENVDGIPDGVVTNPLDYWLAVTSRWANQFDNGFGGGAPASVVGITWDLPVVRTRAIVAGNALVGAFALGSTLFDKESTTIRESDSHEDYFIHNTRAILAEERVGVAWHRPDWFVKCTVPAGT